MFRSAALATCLFAASVCPAASISTIFATNNSGGVGNPVMFNISVLNPSGIFINAMDVNQASGGVAGNPLSLDVYITPTTYVGNESTPGAWTLVSSGTGVTAASNTPANVVLTSFFLAAGNYGMAVNSTNMTQGYTNGANVYSNADLQISTGASAGGGFFVGSPNSPRTWNGTIYYDNAGEVPEPATVALSAAGLLGLVLLRKRK